MTYNQNFYNQFTFHGNGFMPPTNFPVPPPPPFTEVRIPSDSCEDLIKALESKIALKKQVKKSHMPISEFCFQIRNIVCLTNNLKDKQKYLDENLALLSEGDWASHIDELKMKKTLVEGLLMQMNDNYLDCMKKALTKRAAKRARIKRVKSELKHIKIQKIQEWEERSRKIDEDLQKTKEDIENAKKDEESKLQADAILRDVLRKKHDAKKTITKLDALMKLRRARENTAKGRGVNISETETANFHGNIGKIKSMWHEKLSIYEKEEAELRAQLELNSEKKDLSTNNVGQDVVANLQLWREYLFGGEQLPQLDFMGHEMSFVDNRRQWDQYINVEGSSLPIGWVLPPTS